MVGNWLTIYVGDDVDNVADNGPDCEYLEANKFVSLNVKKNANESLLIYDFRWKKLNEVPVLCIKFVHE